MATEKRLIDANALIKDWNELTQRMVRDTDGKIPVDFGLVIRELSKAPTVDSVEVVHGQWEPHPNHAGFDRCSVCHDCVIGSDWAHTGKWKFCPHCGAKMGGDGNG